ncbi:hypothetical protein BLNAU_23054 [Blattamonas nauphoetae]|uniref:Protein kinase domain-containing protein n=1 Tax=Blattamonas nauphoetae TaxID=2049346 RepID=A0ABQ9WVI3_9EUKA|nr:hypothetical protein BLNAU_23054 [Blattamonas nauphoetae]
MDITLLTHSEEAGQKKNEGGSPRLAIVTDSMLTISESRIDVSPWTSAILISQSKLEESATGSSVVISKSWLWNEVGSMRGVVETSSFPSLGGSVSVSIVGCSFDSSRILGNDGIDLSLTRTPRQRSEEVGTISSSLIRCSFMNMSSIGFSHQPQLSHLNQKMLGCVVSLTRSHLSGSTIRDMNTGGSVLCSNSSFSSLLSSPSTDSITNEDPSIILDGSYTLEYNDGTPYFFDNETPQSISASFSHCHFTAGDYLDQARPLTFSSYPGMISILFCSFTNIHHPESYGSGGAMDVVITKRNDHTYFTSTSSNFTNCSSKQQGGAMYLLIADNALINSCSFENCSSGKAGGLDILGAGVVFNAGKQLKIVDCVFADCTTTSEAAGVYITGPLNLVVADTKFERCVNLTDRSAIYARGQTFVNVSNTLVKNCHSGTTGTIFIVQNKENGHLSFSNVFFDGNSIGNDTTFFTQYPIKVNGNATRFTDVAITCLAFPVLPTYTVDDCFTTTLLDSVGMIVNGSKDPSTSLYDTERFLDEEFEKVGPRLKAEPTAGVNEETGKIELEMKGKTPPISQKYEVAVTGADGTDTRFRMLFSDGTGTLVSGSEENLKYNASYTITSIVGVDPEPSSSRMTNDITIPRAAWTFNLAATPSTFLTFTTPTPPTLIGAKAHLVLPDQPLADVSVMLTKEVKGLYHIVVEEEGKNVTIAVEFDESSLMGDSSHFVVVGEDRVLTHNTTYTIKSIAQSPGTESPFVWMNETITFHIPESSFTPRKSLSPQMKAMLSWLIPLVACLLIALLIAIVVILLCRRKQKKNAEPAQTEMAAQDQVEFDEKMDFLADNQTRDVLHTDGRSHAAFDSSSTLPTNLCQSSDGVKSMSEMKGDLVEVMACNGAFQVSAVGDSTTLYSVLHKEKRDIAKRAVGMQLVNGLKAILANRQTSDVMTRLSSHWILLDKEGNVQLKLQMNAAEAEQEAAQTKRQDGGLEGNGTLPNRPNDMEQAGMDGLRWRAPEVVAGGGSGVDGHKASVFSLGLVLWEIETGQVPFGELDAVNAQRQSATGIGPKMDSLQNESFIALILQCVSANPEQRPSLSEIGEFLSSHPEESHLPSHNEMKDQTQ